MQTYFAGILTVAAFVNAVAAQNHVVAPAAFTGIDALSYEWLGGATSQQRQQTLVGASHLGSMIGHSIHAIELRRTTVPEAYQSGAVHWQITLSTSPNLPVNCDNAFAANTGPDAVQVFDGDVELPASPATTGPGSPIAWTPENTVRVELMRPFLYLGGTLCIDVLGTPVAGKNTWWMADAAEEVIAGMTTTEIGAGCGGYGGPARAWSRVHTRTLVPGGRATFHANGTPNGPALAMIGTGMPNAVPLSLLGIQTPNCFCHLDPTSIAAMVPTVFVPEVHPLAMPRATAEVLVQIPASAATFGVQMTTQWFDLLELATSNAITWTVGSSIPTLDMALNEGHPSGATGNVTNYLAHVLRFEYQ